MILGHEKVPQLPVRTRNRDREIVSIERVYTTSTFYMKSAVHIALLLCNELN